MAWKVPKTPRDLEWHEYPAPAPKSRSDRIVVWREGAHLEVLFAESTFNATSYFWCSEEETLEPYLFWAYLGPQCGKPSFPIFESNHA